MKPRQIMLWGSILALIAVLILLGYSHAMTSPQPPYFETVGGVYEEAVDVKLKAPFGCEIYYTLDGSVPSIDSIKYEGIIHIENRSQAPNFYRAIPNVVADYLEKEIIAEPVDKATVVRAVAVSHLGNMSDVCTETYFVGLPDYGLDYLVSLVGNPEDLFGENGICVTGKEYDEHYLKGESVDDIIPNYEKRLEIGAEVEIYGAEGTVLHQRVGAMIQGSSTRRFANKRFKLYARPQYGGSELFDHEVFEGTKSHSVMFKYSPVDAMAYDLLEDRDVSLQQSRSAVLFVNGEVWDSTNVLERYDKHYFEEHYGIKNLILVKEGEVIKGADKQDGETYEQFMQWIADTDFTDMNNWNLLNTKMDVQSYIDFMCANIYLCNVDYCETTNYMLWRTASNEGIEKGDGRWRWIVYDIDSYKWAVQHAGVDILAQVNPFQVTFPYTPQKKIKEQVIWSALFPNEEFRRLFSLSLQDMINHNFAPERVSHIIEEHERDMSYEDYFFEKRPAYMFEILQDEFRLQGELNTLKILADSNKCTIQINSIPQIDLSNGEWYGKYYSDYPIRITVNPKKGQTFVGWEGDISSMERTIEVSLEQNMELRAVFR